MSASPTRDTDAEPEPEVAQDSNDGGDQQGDPGESGDATTQEVAMYETEVKEQDRWLPIANVARIMKTALPDNAKIAKEAKECMQECVSEFISFITSEAAEKCQHEKRKTVNGEDILFAMTSLGFENYGEALKIYLSRYRDSQTASTKHGDQSTPHTSTTAARRQSHAGQQNSMYFDDSTSNLPQDNNRAGSIGSAGSGLAAHEALQGAIQSRPASRGGGIDAKPQPFVSGGVQTDHANTTLPDGLSSLQGTGLPSEMLGDDVDDTIDRDVLGDVHKVDSVDGDVVDSGEYS